MATGPSWVFVFGHAWIVGFAVVHDSVIGKFGVAKFLIVTTSGRS